MIYAKELFSFILVLDDNEESPDKDAVEDNEESPDKDEESPDKDAVEDNKESPETDEEEIIIKRKGKKFFGGIC